RLRRRDRRRDRARGGIVRQSARHRRDREREASRERLRAERERLATALGQIETPGPFCGNSGARVTWNAFDRRYVIKVRHAHPDCPALRPGVYKDRGESYLIGLLELYGVRVAEYCDDLISWHEAR